MQHQGRHTEPGEKVVPETLAIRSARGDKRNASEEGHESCANEGDKLLREGLLNRSKTYIGDLSNVLKQRREQTQPYSVPEHLINGRFESHPCIFGIAVHGLCAQNSACCSASAQRSLFSCNGNLRRNAG